MNIFSHKKLDKLRLALKNITVDVECGLHSGFKPCCVAWFSLVSTPANYYYKPLYRGTRYLLHFMQLWYKRNGYGHIPCPLCLIRNNPIPESSVKSCAKIKHRFSWSDGQMKKARKYVNIPANGIYSAGGKHFSIEEDGSIIPYVDEMEAVNKWIDDIFKYIIDPLRNDNEDFHG